MELEQRVKTLEYELKILKNEIQRTLLDIQEQVLVHYYPTLRMEETQVPVAVVQAVEAARAKQPARPEPAASAAPAPAAVEPAPPPAAPAEAAAPAVKKVSLNDIRAARTESAPAPAGNPQANLIKVIEWAVNSTTKFGHDRTIQLIDVLAAKGIIDQTAKGMLAPVLALNKGAGPEKVVVNDLLDELLKLDKLLGRTADAEEALTLIEEAKLG